MSLAGKNTFKINVNIAGIDEIVNSINDINTPVNDNSVQIALNTANIGTLQTDTNTNETNITDHETRVSTLETTQNSQDVSIATFLTEMMIRQIPRFVSWQTKYAGSYLSAPVDEVTSLNILSATTIEERMTT